MKPVAIFRYIPIEGPGYFATFLDNNHIPWQLIKIDAGDGVPDTVAAYSGLVFMGGPMSVNDDLPWIEPTLELIRLAIEQNIPVLGHCLGGQLMAKALGGRVTQNPYKEMGWGMVNVRNNAVAQSWFDDLNEFETFHWHGETFSLPDGATCILSSEHCENQAFALGIHLGMQCHVEMTEHMVKDWCDVSYAEIVQLNEPAVQSPADMETDLDGRVSRLNTVAQCLYTQWVSALNR